MSLFGFNPIPYKPEPLEDEKVRDLIWRHRIAESYAPIIHDPLFVVRVTNERASMPLHLLPRKPRSKKKRIQKKWRKAVREARRKFYG